MTSQSVLEPDIAGLNFDPPYRNRTEAGRTLAVYLRQFARVPVVTILALPRGGVPVAYEVAKSLRAPLDIFMVRKLGVPGHEELAFGAIASGGIEILHSAVIQRFKISDEEIATVTAREWQELERRKNLYRGELPEQEIAGKIAIVVDDGLATGATMLAAVQALRKRQPAEIIAAAPVGTREACALISGSVERVICPFLPQRLVSIGEWYEDFSEVSDKRVQDLLGRFPFR